MSYVGERKVVMRVDGKPSCRKRPDGYCLQHDGYCEQPHPEVRPGAMLSYGAWHDNSGTSNTVIEVNP